MKTYYCIVLQIHIERLKYQFTIKAGIYFF